MKRRASYVIPTLLAAGLAPISAVAEDESKSPVDQDGSMFDAIKNIVSGIEESHTFTLAQHRSHYSHQSHGSHRSHRSGSLRNSPIGEGDGLTSLMDSSTTRNELSTPPTAILPSSPAIAKKLKVLPGNSAKFEALVTRVQLALTGEGYDVGEVDGRLHARTVAAVYQYQQDREMVPSGKITSDVLSSLSIIAQ